MGRIGESTLHRGQAEDVYDAWPAPDLIVSDGAYGIGGFPTDPRTPEALTDWYGGHVGRWAARSHAATTLWFWNTEIGWATVHPLLAAHGWEYVQTITWDKGIRHVAGNVNGDTIRRVPTVTEVCVFYRRKLVFPSPDGPRPIREWLREEWERTGLPLHRANAACGVKSAATRKYLTRDWLWYAPPAAIMERLAQYANRHGEPEGRPYFAADGRQPVTARTWERLRHPWHHEHGLTNVWNHPPLGGAERRRGDGRRVAPRAHGRQARVGVAHLNQKPLELMQRILTLASDEGDTIWEPFGGLCTTAAAAMESGRNAFAAEPDAYFAQLAGERLDLIKSALEKSQVTESREHTR